MIFLHDGEVLTRSRQSCFRTRSSCEIGLVAVAGRPNVGKSTLVNALAGGKVAIVSDKPQTTRRRISAAVDGELDGEPYQLVLVDLPGFQRPRDALTGRMQRTVDEALEDVDGILFVLAADETIGDGDRFIAERVFGRARSSSSTRSTA